MDLTFARQAIIINLMIETTFLSPCAMVMRSAVMMNHGKFGLGRMGSS